LITRRGLGTTHLGETLSESRADEASDRALHEQVDEISDDQDGRDGDSHHRRIGQPPVQLQHDGVAQVEVGQVQRIGQGADDDKTPPTQPGQPSQRGRGHDQEEGGEHQVGDQRPRRVHLLPTDIDADVVHGEDPRRDEHGPQQ